jgi:hypothetical protein
MTVDFEASTNPINHLPKIGKGEVHSSILCGSTTKPNKISHFQRRSPALDVAIAQNEARNAQVDPWKIRGLCSVGVRR